MQAPPHILLRLECDMTTLRGLIFQTRPHPQT